MRDSKSSKLSKSKQEGDKKKGVVVDMRRAKPGGEYGPDGHWYPGGAWMPLGDFVGAKKVEGQGQGSLADQGKGGKPKDGPTKVIKNKKPEPPPSEPSGKGVDKPEGLKKKATAHDSKYFNERGFLDLKEISKNPYQQEELGRSGAAAISNRVSERDLDKAIRLLERRIEDKNFIKSSWEIFNFDRSMEDFNISKKFVPLSSKVSEDHFYKAYWLTQLVGMSRDPEGKREGLAKNVWIVNNILKDISEGKL